MLFVVLLLEKWYISRRGRIVITWPVYTKLLLLLPLLQLLLLQRRQRIVLAILCTNGHENSYTH